MLPPSVSPKLKNSIVWIRPTNIGCYGDQKNFRLIIDSHSSTNPENMAKLCPVDVEIIDVTETEANIFL